MFISGALTGGMDERAQIARLHRRFGFGLVAGELDAAVGRGLEAEITRLIDPDRAGIAPTPSPFQGLDLSYAKGQNTDRLVIAVDAWLGRMVTSSRGLEERLGWLWHGLLVSSAAKVRGTDAMTQQLALFWKLGAGSMTDLYKAITIDHAMLIYLDGRDSIGTSPNENYGRELLELFSLGVGNYNEDDVKAAAAALSGWTVRVNRDLAAVFQARRHDNAPRRFLGVDGVHDVDTVVAAVTQQPACATYLAGKIGRALLGPNLDPAVIAALADSFRQSGLHVGSLLTQIIDLHKTDVDGGPIVLAPVPWLVMAERATGARLKAKQHANGLRAAGQVPFLPPNVAGWPSGRVWYSSATEVARLNLATVVAGSTPPDSPTLQAAKAGDWSLLARNLGLPSDFSAPSIAGLSSTPDAFARVALALVTPEFVEA